MYHKKPDMPNKPLSEWIRVKSSKATQEKQSIYDFGWCESKRKTTSHKKSTARCTEVGN